MNSVSIMIKVYDYQYRFWVTQAWMKLGFFSPRSENMRVAYSIRLRLKIKKSNTGFFEKRIKSNNSIFSLTTQTFVPNIAQILQQLFETNNRPAPWHTHTQTKNKTKNPTTTTTELWPCRYTAHTRRNRGPIIATSKLLWAKPNVGKGIKTNKQANKGKERKTKPR